MAFNAVDYVSNQVGDWRAHDGGLTRAAVDAIADAHKVQALAEAQDIDGLEHWAFDDRDIIAFAADAAIASIEQTDGLCTPRR